MAVRIESTSGTGYGTTVVDIPSGQEVRGIGSIDIAIRPGEPNTADIKMLLVQADVEAIPTYSIIHPITGKVVEIAGFILADGQHSLLPVRSKE